MAKKEKVSSYTFPSHFGSHRSMIDEEVSAESLATEQELTKVIAEVDFEERQGLLAKRNELVFVPTDEFGSYQTTRFHLDDKLADPNRSAENRLAKLFAKKKDEAK